MNENAESSAAPTQLHPAGLITGPALLLVLVAAIGTANAAIITSAALVFLFLLVTSSLSNHAIAYAARQRGGDRPGTTRTGR